MGALWSTPRPPPNASKVSMGAGGEELFDAPIDFRVHLSESDDGPPRTVFWRVEFEVDVADASDTRVLLQTPPTALSGVHVVRAPRDAFVALSGAVPADRLCNVCAMHFVLVNPEGEEVMRLTAVVEVYRADKECKLWTGTLRRRVYAPAAGSDGSEAG